MNYSVVTTAITVLSPNLYCKMQQGFRLKKTIIHTFASGLSKNDAISYYDRIKRYEHPLKDIVDSDSLSVITCNVQDNYKTNIAENHKGEA